MAFRGGTTADHVDLVAEARQAVRLPVGLRCDATVGGVGRVLLGDEGNAHVMPSSAACGTACSAQGASAAGDGCPAPPPHLRPAPRCGRPCGWWRGGER